MSKILRGTSSLNPTAHLAFCKKFYNNKSELINVFPAGDTWAMLTSLPTWAKGMAPAGTKLLLDHPMIAAGATLEQVVTGACDQYYIQFAKNALANFVPSNPALVRIGREMNGTWYSWNAIGREKLWAQAYNHIAKIFVDYSGGTLLPMICTTNGNEHGMNYSTLMNNLDWQLVFALGTDLYDTKWQDTKISPEARWSWILNQPNGLAWLAGSAEQHKLPVYLCEWGLDRPGDSMSGGAGGTGLGFGGGGADDTVYVQSTYDWLHSLDYLAGGICVLSTDAEQGNHHAMEDFPNASALFQKLWTPDQIIQDPTANPAPVQAPVSVSPTGTPVPPVKVTGPGGTVTTVNLPAKHPAPKLYCSNYKERYSKYAAGGHSYMTNDWVYFFVEDIGYIKSVTFTVDGKSPRTETLPPFDLMGTAVDGTANPYSVKRGGHFITAHVTYTDGQVAAVTSKILGV
jgi:hypothetical protein